MFNGRCHCCHQYICFDWRFTSHSSMTHSFLSLTPSPSFGALLALVAVAFNSLFPFWHDSSFYIMMIIIVRKMCFKISCSSSNKTDSLGSMVFEMCWLNATFSSAVCVDIIP